MMKNIKIWILIVLIVSACSEEYLTLAPQGTLFSSEYFKTPDEVEEALIASYDVLGHQKGIGLAFAPPLLLAEIMSDDAFAGGQDAGDGAEENEFNTFDFSTNNEVVRSLWKKGYFGIYSANFTIQNALNLVDGEDAVRVNQYIAEAYFLRAYFHFELVKFFENIPLITSVPSSIEEAESVLQTSPTEVYNQIATDLVAAISGLPEATQTIRATKWAAQALLGRAYLFYNGVYGQDLTTSSGLTIDKLYVLQQLNDLIDNSGHALLLNYEDIFNQENELSVESVFEIAYEPLPIGGDWGSEHKVEGNLAAQMMGPRASGGTGLWYRGWSFGVMTNKIYQAMQGDPRLDATILTQETIIGTGASLNTGAYQHTGYYNNKYTTEITDQGTGGTTELHNTRNHRVIRYSDVLLMQAELSQDATRLNEVRRRVGLADITYSEEALFNERRMELAGEGLRYFDILRRGASIASQELTVTNDIGPNYTDTPLSVYDVTFNSASRGFLPIPETEIDLSNGTLVQNDGY